jgi:5'-deoxynucleotidase YfbR-like HD superfamily hydrolase
MSKKTAREKLKEFLEANEGRELGLDKLYPYFRLLTGALAEEKRWKTLVRLSRETKCSRKGEAMSETVQDHISVDVPMLGAAMLAIEVRYGTKGLICELLNLAFVLHDYGEALGGDKYLPTKTKADDEEDAAFDKIISVFPPPARSYFKSAYAIAGERAVAKRAGLPLSSISLNGRFFGAVEIAGYLTKAFFEVEKGNKPFAKVFYDQLEDDMFLLMEEFYSFRVMIFPFLNKMAEHMKKNQYVEIKQK